MTVSHPNKDAIAISALQGPNLGVGAAKALFLLTCVRIKSFSLLPRNQCGGLGKIEVHDVAEC